VLGACAYRLPAPSHFGRLHAFADKTLNRPGVDEFIFLLGTFGLLRVAPRKFDGRAAERPSALRRAACVFFF